MVGLYFFVYWCLLCCGFMLKLFEFYQKYYVDKKFEIIFVSLDKKEEEYKYYFEEMFWFVLLYFD